MSDERDEMIHAILGGANEESVGRTGTCETCKKRFPMRVLRYEIIFVPVEHRTATMLTKGDSGYAVSLCPRCFEKLAFQRKLVFIEEFISDFFWPAIATLAAIIALVLLFFWFYRLGWFSFL
jgi:hypothetical protein